MTEATAPAVVRAPTAIDAIAEDWVDTLVDLDPAVGVWIGRDAGDAFADQAPSGAERFDAAARATIAALEAATPVDEIDRVTRVDLLAALRLDLERHEAGLHLRDLNVIASPVQEIRETFDLMPQESADDLDRIVARMARVPDAVAGYLETLRLGIERGVVPARRQVRAVLAQLPEIVADDGFFHGLAVGHPGASRAAELAATAYRRLAAFLDERLLPSASEHDAVGRSHYELASRSFLGAQVDLDETYEWGLDELRRMIDEQSAVARRVHPDGLEAAIAVLDADPARRIRGVEALQRWLQATSDRVLAELAGTAFHIPDPVRRLECRIAPTTAGGVYYTGPSDDFSRPGTMWWSVPDGVEAFSTWRELTTVFHEGVPGHHLQIGTAVSQAASLNTWRRQLAGTSGHAEGWALYAERLMADLGYLDDPGDRLGMLDGQRMRAARVVLDIGVHLGKPMPDGSGAWTAERALEFFRRNVSMDEANLRFEVLRYLGWPGQAPSYKIGQRIWEAERDAARRARGSAFDLAEWHRRALELGGVGLDTLRAALRAPDVADGVGR